MIDSKTRIAYYSNSMATQALLLSGDVEKNPGPSQGKAASTNNQLSRSKPTAEKCDHCQKTIRWNQKNISCASCMGCFHLRAHDCKYRESLARLKKSKILIICQKNPFGELSSKKIFSTFKNL